jgi:gentisate 1,2-dioxygenase
MLEYTANANPAMSEVPVRIFPAALHTSGPTRVVPLDLSDALQLDYPATAPNLLASFLRIDESDNLETGVTHATSQSFYVIRGSGYSDTRAGRVEWQAGDLFVLPYLGDSSPSVCVDDHGLNQCVRHHCNSEPTHGGCALYYVHDEPLLRYLGARPVDTRRFQPALYPGATMIETVHGITRLDETGAVRNRRGILLSSPDSPQTKTLTPTLWSLLNSIDAGADQAPHRHNSVALDLAVSSGGDGGSGGGEVYTLLGRGLHANGSIVEPLKVEWESGGVFVTPPGWWHSHHNDAAETAWVLPMQDAGLYTHQRTLDIRFQAEEAARLKEGWHRGATQSATTADSPGAKSDAESPAGAELGGGAGAGDFVEPLVVGTLMFGHLA